MATIALSVASTSFAQKPFSRSSASLRRSWRSYLFCFSSSSFRPVFGNFSSPVPSIVLPPAVGQSFVRAGALAVLTASLCLVDPALAFKGGGPYGAEVTRGQDLTGKDFSSKSLVKQDFKTSILRQANFRGAKLVGASFFDADLTGADLSDADLRGADLSLANIAKANLSNANLEGALTTGNTSFRGSIIKGADFTDVPLREDQREYLCKVADGVNPTTGNATRETLLCN
ncbi:Thylakoid lumenal 15 kDa protein 1, chloroplastic [Apostasia shenzhenica]|uniref:Thylakoid lumenal 15 kDa protein 1, chloroplastic n=1 Tax=Apostasia shenzhenica TaxID=1088818 RepID=A0A2I0B5S0_9ASPA|nr:Thylakoid lumenal 15 kDa protein 1, chloroplastic [Apostasia shenzhenica]